MIIHAISLDRREFLTKAGPTTAAVAVCAGLDFMAVPLIANAGETGRSRVSRISYYCDGRIYVGEPGQPDGKPLTQGHWDFKPSWSKTGDRLVCFRRLKDDPVTVNWKTAIFVINVDGTGFHTLSDGTHTDFNPTWTRDGKNTPLWNRKNDKTGGFMVVQSKVGGKPGEEVAVTDARFHNWAHSCLNDGRILVNAMHPMLGWGVFMLSRTADGKPRYERIECELAVVYHLNSTGKGQLYVYQLQDGSTRRVSTNPNADYRYPHGEAAPC